MALQITDSGRHHLMRQAFIQELVTRAEHDPSIVLLTGDLGYSVLEPFQQRFPDRFFNAGVAEQNMVGMAAGMAAMGKKVIVYSIGNFLAFRALEQIRNDVYYPKRHILLVGAGVGMEYGSAGFTHWMIEDLAALSSLEDMPIYTPTNEASLIKCLNDWLIGEGCGYLRLSKQSLGVSAVGDFWVSGRDDAASLAYGHTAVNLIRAGQTTIVFERLHPLDESELNKVFRQFDRLTVVEEHIWAGGLDMRLRRIFRNRLNMDWSPIPE